MRTILSQKACVEKRRCKEAAFVTNVEASAKGSIESKPRWSATQNEGSDAETSE